MLKLKRILLITGLFVVILGTSCFAENWVEVPEYPAAIVDLDSVKNLTMGTDAITRCKVKYTNKKDVYGLATILANTDNNTFCLQLYVEYNNKNQETFRSVNDTRISSNWTVYRDSGEISAILKTIHDNQRAD